MFKKITLPVFCIALITSEIAAQTGQWQTVNSQTSPTARHECAYVKAGNKFYLMGGRGNKPVESYDPASNSWTVETNNSPFQMHHYQGVEYNGKIYVAGAFTGNCCQETPVANIYIYDPVTKQWSTGPAIPSNRRRGAAGCVIHNNKLYLVCGITNGHTSGWVSWLDVLDLQTNTWSQLPDAPRERDHFSATLVNGKIYCIGGRRTGFNGNLFAHTVAEVDIYDIATNTWITLPSTKNIPTQRAGGTTAVLGDEILMIGGESAQVAHAETEAFNVVTQNWRTLSPMLQTRHGSMAVVHNDNIYIATGAGTRGGSNELNSQERFAFSTSPSPPSVSITNPSNGTGFTTPASITINASASTSSGTISKVEFYQGNTLLNTDVTSPYSFNWTNVPAGSYALTAKAFNSFNLSTTSSVVNVSVTAPQSGCVPNEIVSFTVMRTGTAGEIGLLTNGMTINLATIGSFSIRANTCNGQNVGSVRFFLNGSMIQNENIAPYAINGDNPVGSYNTWTTSVGSKTLTATPFTQVNGGGTAGISHTVAFNVINDSGGSLPPDCNGVSGGSASLDDCGVCSGGNTGKVPNANKDACGVCFGNGSSCSGGGCQPLEIVSFTLMRSGTAGEIGPLTNGMTINLGTIGSFSIRANTCNGQNVGSVRFFLNGSMIQNENIAPYAIKGDSPVGSYNAWTTTTGSKTLTATPYSQANGGGTTGISHTVNFNVINDSGAGAPPDCNGVAGGSASLDDCGVCSGGNTGKIPNANKDVCGVCFGNGSSCSGGGCQPLEIVSFTLMRLGTAGEIGPLSNGMTINLAAIGSFSIRANTCNGQNVGSVRFFLNGSMIQNENIAPYAINGDNPVGNYNAWNVSPGNYTLTATPYSSHSGTGTAGISLTRSFTVVSSSQKNDWSETFEQDAQRISFNVFPNPNKGRFMLDFEIAETSDVNLVIYSPLGQAVFTASWLQSEGAIMREISLEQHPAGMYFLRAAVGGKIFSEKILIGN